MKQRVVFLFYHGFGHIIAVLKLAHMLRDANYDVYFAGAGYFRQYISSLGLKFYLLKSLSFGYGFEKWSNTNQKKRHIYFSTLWDRITDKLYKDREVELYWMLEDLKPATVLLDSRQATDFIVMYSHLKKRSIKIGLVHPMLPLHYVPGRPPLNSGVYPEDEAGIKQATRIMKWDQLKKACKKKLMYLGFDDQFIIKRRLRKNALPKQFIVKNPGLINFALKGIDEFIISPKEFDFPDVVPEPMQHFTGFMTLESRNELWQPDFITTAPAIFELRKNSGAKLIFCSFGTVEPKEQVVIISFLKKFIKVAAEEKHLLLISFKGKREDLGPLKKSENVYIFDTVPQLEVLKHADLFITHGGINSVKESIHAEVPMLVYPIHPEFDPNGNAARIVYHSLGLRGKAALDTAAELGAKIKVLLTNPVYKQNIQRLKLKDLGYTSAMFLEKFNSIKPLL